MLVEAVRRIVEPFFPVFEPQSVDCSRPCLIHDPPDDGSIRRIVSRRSSPYIVEHIERHFFSSFAIAGYPHYQGKDNSMRLFVKRMQRELIPGGDGLDKSDPSMFGHSSLGLTEAKQIVEDSGLRFMHVLVCAHDLNLALSNRLASRAANGRIVRA